MVQVLVFTVAGQRYGLPLEQLGEVLRAAALVPLPKAPAIVEGVLNVRGDIVPVLDLRARFRLAARPVAASDRLILARTRGRTVALRADSVGDIAALAAESIVPAERLGDRVELIRGAARMPDGLLLIQDLDAFLAGDEARELDAALRAREA